MGSGYVNAERGLIPDLVFMLVVCFVTLYPSWDWLLWKLMWGYIHEGMYV